MLVTLAPQLESKDVVAHCKRFLPKVTDVSRCILRLKRRAGTFKVRHRASLTVFMQRGHEVGMPLTHRTCPCPGLTIRTG